MKASDLEEKPASLIDIKAIEIATQVANILRESVVEGGCRKCGGKAIRPSKGNIDRLNRLLPRLNFVDADFGGVCSKCAKASDVKRSIFEEA